MTGRWQQVLGRLHGLAGQPAAASPDQQLLARFLESGDADAFAALVQRHGGLVWSACQRLLAHQQDAEDVFQATFMVLAKKAGTIRGTEALGPWLYRVAYHLGVKARGQQARRQQCEREAMAVHQERNRDVAMPEQDSVRRELLACLDRELQQLPEKYRGPLVLCDLQGKSHEEAARELACPQGSLSRHLQRGRELLRDRLVGRGIALSTAALAACLADSARASAPVDLLQQTTQHAVQFASGSNVATAARAAQFANGALRSMNLFKLKIVVACAVVVSLGAWVTLAAMAPVTPADPNAPVDPKGKVVGKAKNYGEVEIKLIANQSRYEVNLGGRTAKEVRAELEAKNLFRKPRPAEVDLAIELKNVSDKPIQFWSTGDPVYFDLSLSGPDAVTIPSSLPMTADFRLPQAMVLQPGKTHTYQIKMLASGPRGVSTNHYWLVPGNYQLSATLRTAFSPGLKGSQPGEDGFAMSYLVTEPITVKVVAGKGGLIEKTPPAPPRRGNGNNGRGGQGGGFVPGNSGPAVLPDSGGPVEKK